MSAYSVLKIGKFYKFFNGFIPNFYTFFLKGKYLFVEKDENDDSQYLQLGYKTNCLEIKNLMKKYGYTLEFLSEIYAFFKKDLLIALKIELADIHGISPNSPEIEQYINSTYSTSTIDEFKGFIEHIKLLFNLDFESPPFDSSYNEFQSAREAFSSILDNKTFQIVDSGIHLYFLRNYQKFPHWVILIYLFLNGMYEEAGEFYEIEELIFLILMLEASDNEDEFILDISDVVNQEYVEIENMDTYLDEEFFDISEAIIHKINVYNTVFNKLFENEENINKRFVKSQCKLLLQQCDEAKTNDEKGRILEDLVEILFTKNNFLKISERNLHLGDEEIDLVLINNINRPFWLAFDSPLLFIECKNWKKPIGASELRNFEGKLSNHKKFVKIGFFVGLGGFTKEVISALKRMSRDGQHIVLITREDIEGFISSDIYFIDWLEKLTAKVY
jgi:hypothetical protein